MATLVECGLGVVFQYPVLQLVDRSVGTGGGRLLSGQEQGLSGPGGEPGVEMSPILGSPCLCK